MGAGVEPCEAAPERLHFQFTILEEALVHGRDLQFAAIRGLDCCGYIDHLVGVEVEAYDGIVRLRLRRFLLDAEAVAMGVEFSHTIALGVVHPIAEHGGFALMLGRVDGLAQQRSEARAVEDVVAQDQACCIVAYELAPDDEGLGQSVGRWLLGVAKIDAVVRTIAQQAAEGGQVVGRRDHEDVADASLHQHRDGVIDHRFIEDRQQLFRHTFRDGVEACAGAAGQYYSFHTSVRFIVIRLQR